MTYPMLLLAYRMALLGYRMALLGYQMPLLASLFAFLVGNQSTFLVGHQEMALPLLLQT